MTKVEACVSEEKKKTVDEFAKLMTQYPIIGIVNMENFPAGKLTVMRKMLRNSVVLKMTKKRLLKLAIEKVKDKKPSIEKLEMYMKGMPAVIFTKDNPFKLYNLIKKSKSKAPIKPGQVAPKDIIVPAGPTSFAPGPVIGELAQLGIKAGVEGGKIAIKQDKVVAKEGEIVSPQLAGLLSRLGIEPMEIGLNITAIYEEGVIYDKSVLSVDEQQYLDNIIQAHNWAVNLAVEAGIFNKEVIELMIIKAERESKSLAQEANLE